VQEETFHLYSQQQKAFRLSAGKDHGTSLAVARNDEQYFERGS
jgi:hypothetical protein